MKHLRIPRVLACLVLLASHAPGAAAERILAAGSSTLLLVATAEDGSPSLEVRSAEDGALLRTVAAPPGLAAVRFDPSQGEYWGPGARESRSFLWSLPEALDFEYGEMRLAVAAVRGAVQWSNGDRFLTIVRSGDASDRLALQLLSRSAMTAACPLPERKGDPKGRFLGPDVTEPGATYIVVAHDPCRTLEPPAVEDRSERTFVETRVNGEWLACAEDGSACWITKGAGSRWDRTSPIPMPQGGGRVQSLLASGGKSPVLYAIVEAGDGVRLLTSRDRGKAWREVTLASVPGTMSAAAAPRGLWLLHAAREAAPQATLRFVNEGGDAEKAIVLR